MSALTRQCWQPWESLNIAADGKVYPCCVVRPALEIGNLETQTLHDIVVGDRMLAIKRKLLSGDIGALPCADCPNAPLVEPPVFKSALAERYAEKPPEAAPVAQEPLTFADHGEDEEHSSIRQSGRASAAAV